MLKRKKNYILWILSSFFICFIFIIGYSQYTSKRIEKEINQEITIKPFTTYSMQEVQNYLNSNSYEIIEEIKGTEINEKSHYLTAEKSDEYLCIEDEGYNWIRYTMKKTDDVITPLIYGIEFGDSYETVHEKIGLIYFNTLLQKAFSLVNPRIYILKGCHIELVCKENYRYNLYFEDGYLQLIIVQNFSTT